MFGLGQMDLLVHYRILQYQMQLLSILALMNYA